MAEKQFVGNAKVAAIVAPTVMAINLGTNGGVEVDDEVTLHRRVDIRDPDTGESLGVVTFPRLRFKVTSVADRLAIAQITNRAKVNRAGLPPLLELTEDQRDESPLHALVTIGEAALVQRDRPAGDDEPPF